MQPLIPVTSTRVNKYIKYIFYSFFIFQIININAHENVKVTSNASLFSGLNSEVATLVDNFHQALKNDDAETVKMLLADDVIIFEGGKVERSVSEYAQHHMQADMDFLKQMQIKKLEHHIRVNGDTATSMTRTQVKGSYKEKNIDSETMETLVLELKKDQWKIIHIHWSN